MHLILLSLPDDDYKQALGLSLHYLKILISNSKSAAIALFNRGKSATHPLFNYMVVLSSASDKTKLFAKNFSKNSNLDD